MLRCHLTGMLDFLMTYTNILFHRYIQMSETIGSIVTLTMFHQERVVYRSEHSPNSVYAQGVLAAAVYASALHVPCKLQ